MDLQIEPFIKVIFIFTLFIHYNISPEGVMAAWNRSHTPHQAHGFFPSVRSPKTEIICNCKEEPEVNLSFHLQNFKVPRSKTHRTRRPCGCWCSVRRPPSSAHLLTDEGSEESPGVQDADSPPAPSASRPPEPDGGWRRGREACRRWKMACMDKRRELRAVRVQGASSFRWQTSLIVFPQGWPGVFGLINILTLKKKNLKLLISIFIKIHFYRKSKYFFWQPFTGFPLSKRNNLRRKKDVHVFFQQIIVFFSVQETWIIY